MMKNETFTDVAISQDNIQPSDIVSSALELIQEWVKTWLYPVQGEPVLAQDTQQIPSEVMFAHVEEEPVATADQDFTAQAEEEGGIQPQDDSEEQTENNTFFEPEETADVFQNVGEENPFIQASQEESERTPAFLTQDEEGLHDSFAENADSDEDETDDWDSQEWEEDWTDEGEGAENSSEDQKVVLKEKPTDLDPLWQADDEDNPFTNRQVGLGLNFNTSYEPPPKEENLAFNMLAEGGKETNSADVVHEEVKGLEVEEDDLKDGMPIEAQGDDRDEDFEDEEDWEELWDDADEAEESQDEAARKVDLAHMYHDMDLEELAFNKAGDLPPPSKDSLAYRLQNDEEPLEESLSKDQNILEGPKDTQVRKYFDEVSKNLIILLESFDKLRFKVEVLAQKVDTLLAEKDKSENK